LAKAKLPLTKDDLGRPGEENALPPVSKRWRISYAAPLSAFIERAKHLSLQLEKQGRLSQDTSTESGHE
jgi:hypothetical protein